MADDNIANALEELSKVVDYGKRYGSDFRFKETELRLVRAIQFLVAEIEALRDGN